MTRFTRWLQVTPSNTVNFDGQVSVLGEHTLKCDAIHVGGAGVVDLVAEDGTVGSFTCVAGEIIPYAGVRVKATSTATLMWALWY